MVMLVFTLPIYSYHPKTSNTNSLEDEMYSNFLAAVKNSSTFNYFTVIKVKNLNTGIIKEICTKGNFVSGAVHIELNAAYDKKGEAKVLDFIKTKKNRYFEFRNKKALANISFFEYDTVMVSTIKDEYDFDKIAESIKADKKFSVSLEHEKMKAFAHVLFNKGYLTGEYSCVGGTLEYVNLNSNK